MQRQAYKDRKRLAQHPLSQRLFSLMHTKRTNLGVTVTQCRVQEVLELANLVGPHICLLKTHVDILEDFTPEFTYRLRSIADKHGFLIFEDRRYSDVGKIIEHQYQGGLYRIADWSDLVSVHIFSGEEILSSLSAIGVPKGRGVILLAGDCIEGVSREGSLVAVRWAEKHPNFVVGFECVRRLCLNEGFLHISSVHKILEQDVFHLSESFPEQVIGACGGDIILIDDTFFSGKDPSIIANEYKNRGYTAYNQY